MVDILKVGMADLKVTKAPNRLLTSGLGSCIGICLWDSVAKVAGMAHIMLPNSKQAKNPTNIAKFADTALPELIRQMLLLGACKSRLVAKIAGGAQMFAFASTNEVMRVGDRNIEAVVAGLQELKIPLLVNETGGNYGRTIEFCASTGELMIRTIKCNNVL